MSMTWERLGSMLLEETGNTLLMTLPATFFAYLIGLPLGVLLVITRKDGILPKPTLNRIIGVIVNLLRSVPFIILMVMLFPATRAILGRGTGTVSIIIPLTVSAFPYVARMVEGSLLEVDNGVVEAAQAMGSTTFQIVRKVLIPEAMPVAGQRLCDLHHHNSGLHRDGGHGGRRRLGQGRDYLRPEQAAVRRDVRREHRAGAAGAILPDGRHLAQPRD